MRWLAALLVAGLIWAQGEGREIPPLTDDPAHAGQPRWCQAQDANGFRKNCGICDMKCDEQGNVEEHASCKTYCRKGACSCHGACKTTR